MIKIRPETHDSSFDWVDFIAIIKSDLVNNIGNFVNRCFSISGKICQYNTIYESSQQSTKLIETTDRFQSGIDNFNYRDTINCILDLSTHGNQYLQTEKPWSLSNNLSTRKILGHANMICFTLLFLLTPVISKTANRL